MKVKSYLSLLFLVVIFLNIFPETADGFYKKARQMAIDRCGNNFGWIEKVNSDVLLKYDFLVFRVGRHNPASVRKNVSEITYDAIVIIGDSLEYVQNDKDACMIISRLNSKLSDVRAFEYIKVFAGFRGYKICTAGERAEYRGKDYSLSIAPMGEGWLFSIAVETISRFPTRYRYEIFINKECMMAVVDRKLIDFQRESVE
jgi:hypothetical protein